MSTNTLQANKMGVMSEGKLLMNMALPMIVSMLVQALYNVVDSIFVSQVSESAVTALSLAFPIQNLMIGFATGVGVGIVSDGKLLEAKVDGHDIEENRTYHVATLDYRAEGNDKMFALKKATGRMETGLTIREVLMENVVRHRKITSRMEGRIVIKGNE